MDANAFPPEARLIAPPDDDETADVVCWMCVDVVVVLDVVLDVV